MPNHLFVGGAYDGQSVPVTDDQLEVRLLPVDATDVEVYIRDTLAIGVYESFTFYRHKKLMPEEVLDLLVKYHEAWAVHMNGSPLDSMT
jgi:hypothetical protein